MVASDDLTVLSKNLDGLKPGVVLTCLITCLYNKKGVLVIAERKHHGLPKGSQLLGKVEKFVEQLSGARAMLDSQDELGQHTRSLPRAMQLAQSAKHWRTHIFHRGNVPQAQAEAVAVAVDVSQRSP